MFFGAIYFLIKDQFMDLLAEHYMPDFQAMSDRYSPDQEFNDALDIIYGNHSPETQRKARETMKNYRN